MAETKEKKGFRAGAYAVFAGIAVAVILVILTIFAFTTRYTAFSPEKVAVAYTDGIVQTGDGYNAYKQTLVSKNQKFGNFVIDAYMSPYVNDGKDVKQNEVIGSGSEKEAQLLDGIYNTMYEYYVELINTYGLDDYDAVFSSYFAKLKEVRVAVLADDYMSTEFMFGVFESNVDRYGKELTGTDREFASDNKTITQELTIGKYQEMFGVEQEVEVEALVNGKKKTTTEKLPVYKLTTTVAESKALEGDELQAYLEGYKQRVASANPTIPEGTTDEQKAKIEEANKKLDCSEDISEVTECTLEVKTQDDTVVATQKVYVVRIGNSWYVDHTNVDTTGLYLAK